MYRRFRPDDAAGQLMARLAITSLTFMLVWVPEPVWNTPSGNSSSHLPSITLLRGRRDEIDLAAGKLTQLAVRPGRAFLDDAERADHRSTPAEPVDPDRKVHERCVCAPHSRSAGTSDSTLAHPPPPGSAPGRQCVLHGPLLARIRGPMFRPARSSPRPGQVQDVPDGRGRRGGMPSGENGIVHRFVGLLPTALRDCRPARLAGARP